MTGGERTAISAQETSGSEPLSLCQGDGAALASMQQMMDTLDRQAALVDRHGIIRATNCQWRRAVARRPQQGLNIGDCYTDFLKRLAEGARDGVVMISRAVEEICGGSRWRFSTVYKGSDIFAGHIFKVTASRIYVDRESYAFITVQDVTGRYVGSPRSAEPDSHFMLKPR